MSNSPEAPDEVLADIAINALASTYGCGPEEVPKQTFDLSDPGSRQYFIYCLEAGAPRCTVDCQSLEWELPDWEDASLEEIVERMRGKFVSNLV
jgi:hypothetical protein